MKIIDKKPFYLLCTLLDLPIKLILYFSALDYYQDSDFEATTRKSNHLWTNSGLTVISESTENLHLIDVSEKIASTML